ncbi:MAG: class I SAM-dependent DNA methyltransferase [Promethearchaeota archaeon]
MKTNESFEYLAKYYDLIYNDKDYKNEVTFIEDIFKNTHKPKKILELGCGTGNYTQILLERGYEITGVDISENMLEIAKEKCTCNFIRGSIRDISINDRFDACIAMFAVMGYITENSDIVKVLNNIRRHLKPNGLFVFDVWNGLAVLRILPELRIKVIENDEVKILRIADPKLRSFDHICEVNYKLLILNKVDKTFHEVFEKHIVRFYFPQEIKYFLETAGFEVLKICPFLNLNGKVDETIWNIAVVARVIDGKI